MAAEAHSYTREGWSDTIIIVDEHTLLAECLAAALYERLKHKAIVVPNLTAISSLSDISIALVILKLRATDDDPALCVNAASQVAPGIPLVLLARAESRQALQAIAAGASGVLPLSAPLKIVSAAIELVLAGGTYCPLPLEWTRSRDVDLVEERESGIQQALLRPGRLSADAPPAHPTSTSGDHVRTDRESAPDVAVEASDSCSSFSTRGRRGDGGGSRARDHA
jgi:DNA-binding NarL/FixJ family response regulator